MPRDFQEKHSPRLRADIKDTLKSIPPQLRQRRLNTVEVVREIFDEIREVVRERGRQNIGVEIEDGLLLRLWHSDFGDPEGRSSNWPRMIIEPKRVSFAKSGQLQPPQTFTPGLDIQYKILSHQDENWGIAFENVFNQAVENLRLIDVKPLKLSKPFVRVNLAEVTGEEAIYFGQIPEARLLLEKALKTKSGQVARIQSLIDKLV